VRTISTVPCASQKSANKTALRVLTINMYGVWGAPECLNLPFSLSHSTEVPVAQNPNHLGDRVFYVRPKRDVFPSSCISGVCMHVFVRVYAMCVSVFECVGACVSLCVYVCVCVCV